MEEYFVDDLMNASICPSFWRKMDHCTQDANTKSITTPEDMEKAKAQQVEDAAWYKDEFGAHMVSKEKKKQKNIIYGL